MPSLANMDNCCGCSSCANSCVKGAIAMVSNNEGFLHPVIDVEKCVECGLCEKSCPALEPVVIDNSIKPQAVILQHLDEKIRKQSTSGGAFTAIGEEVIRRGGIVFGAAFIDNFKVKHIGITTVDELWKFRNSKYVQSEIGDSYRLAKKMLSDGRFVCFSGTPCQINGLYKFLGRNYDNLIAVDVVCKSVPSPLIFQKYVEYKKQTEGEICDIVFRDKKRGFLYCTMAHYASDDGKLTANSVYRRGSESDEWLRLFLSGKISRRSCTNCRYQFLNRPGDFTLGDIWETGNALFDDNKGSTLVHIWTDKGRSFLKNISEYVRQTDYPFEQSRGAERTHGLKLMHDRDALFEDVNKLTASQFFSKYAPYSLRVRVKNYSRYILWRLHLQSFVRHIKHMVIHR